MPGLDTQVQRALERSQAGERLSFEEGVALMQCYHLPALGQAAHQARLSCTDPRLVTYVVDRNMSCTNICFSQCLFCAFWRSEDSPQAYVLSVEEVLDKVDEAVALGATQILMQGGLNPNLSPEYYEDVFRAVKSRFNVQVHSLSPPEIVFLAKQNGLSVREVLVRLREAGLDSLPGGGAEILSHRVRSRVSPRKCTADEWIEVMRIAHSMGMPTTATMMFGHVEGPEDRVEHLERLRSLQDETGGFTAFIPWTYQSQNTRLGGPQVGGCEYLRTLAVSRLYLDNFRNIQASWVTQGLKVAQTALFFGANDLGSTMIEENVVRAAGASYEAEEAELRRAIAQAGFVPVRRDTLYRLLEEPVASGAV